MPAPKMPEYPKPMFRGDKDPVYANNGKHEDELTKDGWSEFYIKREYPKDLHHPSEKKSLRVNSKAEEKSAIDDGWLAEPLAHSYGEDDPGIPNLPLPAAPAGESPTVAALMQQVAELTKLVLSQQAKPKQERKPRIPKTPKAE